MWLRIIYILKMSKYLEVSISNRQVTNRLPTVGRHVTDSRPSVDRQIAKTMEKKSADSQWRWVVLHNYQKLNYYWKE